MEVEPNGASLNFPFSSSSFSLTAFPGLSKAEADDRGRGCGGHQEAGPHNIVFAGWYIDWMPRGAQLHYGGAVRKTIKNFQESRKVWTKS